jgi:hypothetical protein
MRDTFGAIDGAQRARFAVGYGAADPSRPFVLGSALMPASWVNVTEGSGSVASTAADMVRFLRSLSAAASGRGGLGLSPAAARAFTSHSVPEGSLGARYGNGLMHRTNEGRSLLHHTGGMVSFSSSFHLDTASGCGAFASSSLNLYADYRPRLLTLYATEALCAAREGRAIPPSPPLTNKIENAADFVGRYGSGPGAFEICGEHNLTLLAGGTAVPLHLKEDDVLASNHPLMGAWPFRFLREDKRVAAAGWGAETFVREGAKANVIPSDPGLAQLAGRYENDSPWELVRRVVERGGRLWLDGVTPLHALPNGSWRPGEDKWNPERIRFANFVGGRPQTMFYSEVPFVRRNA